MFAFGMFRLCSRGLLLKTGRCLFTSTLLQTFVTVPTLFGLFMSGGFMVKISVLMPVYKTPELYLREAIESILKQTFADFEFLILDDCPEDDREAIVKSYKDKRIKYFKNEKNLGISASRNKLIDMAKGEYLAVFDHDDISLPERLEKESQYLDEHPEIGVVGCAVEVFQKKKKIITHPLTDEEIKASLMSVCAIVHPASMIKKNILMINSIRYEAYFSPAEDYRLWCRLIPYTKFHNLPDVLFKYRDHGMNTSKTQQEKMSIASFAIRAQVQAENPALYNFFQMDGLHTYRINLFGFLPLITIRSWRNKTRFYLFEKILLFSYKWSCKLKGKQYA